MFSVYLGDMGTKGDVGISGPRGTPGAIGPEGPRGKRKYLYYVKLLLF